MTPSTPTPSSSTSLDAAGAICSSLCAAHCAATALAPALLTAAGLGTLLGHSFEWGATAVAVALGVVALVVGRNSHRSRWVVAALALGVTGLAAGRLLEMADVHGVGTALSVVAGLSLATGHIGGIVLTRRNRQQAREAVAHQAS